MKVKKRDVVNSPEHYNQGKIEVIEFLEDQNFGFHLANAVKYIARAGKKNPTTFVEDLRKSVWYIQRKIELIESFIERRDPVRPNDMGKK